MAATSPAEFANGLKNALAAITERTGSFSNVAANSTRIDTDTQVFQAKNLRLRNMDWRIECIRCDGGERCFRNAGLEGFRSISR